MISVSLILLLLLQLFLKQFINQTQEPVLLIAIDNSRSMVEGKDSTYLKLQLNSDLAKLKNNLQSQFEIKTLHFGSNSKITSEDPDFSQKETDLQQLLSDVENNYSNSNVGALILLSDGIFNKGANPVYASEKLGFPIYAVAFGDTTDLKDLSVQKIDHNPFAYLGNIFPAEAVIKAQQLKGKEISISLYENTVKKGEKKLKINSDNFLGTVVFTIQAEPAGVHKYTVQEEILEEEKNVRNNAQSFLVDVIDSRYKILLLASSVHPDLSAIKEAIGSNQSYELKMAFANESNENLSAYNLVIVHGYQSSQSSLLSVLRSKNIPFLILNPQVSDNIQFLKFNPVQLKQNDAEPSLNTTFSLFNLSDGLKTLLKELPAVKVPFGNYSTTNGTEMLLYQKIGVVETDHPLLLFNEVAGLKTAVFIGDGLWKWKMRDYAEHNSTELFNELISKTVQYLAVKNDKSLFRLTVPRIISENEPVLLGAEVFNKSYEVITDPEVSLILTNEANKQFSYTFSKSENIYRLNLGNLSPGEYSYEAKTNVSGQSLIKKGKFTVREMQAEKINLVANHKVLFGLSEKTKGKLIYSNELNNLAEEIKKNKVIKPITYSTHQTLSLIDMKWIFLLIILFLSAEWYFRKRYLSI